MALGETFDSILVAAQEGAEWAWQRIYGELAGPVLGYLRTRGAADPENLLGEVFLQLARNIKGFSGGEAAFRSWIFMVAHHRLIDERRARQRRPEELVSSQELASEVGDRGVEDRVLERLSSDRVAELLETLTPDQREVLTLRILGGLTLAETAQVLDKRVNAVKALQHRAVAALRKQMDAEGATL